MEDNFNLRKVFKDYYSGLNEVSTIEELNLKYPKIKTPPDPENVFSKKVENTLTRDFYEELDELMTEGNENKIFNFMNNKLKEYTNAVAAKFKAPADDLHARIYDTTLKNMLDKFMKVRTQDGFSSVPEIRKNKIPQITETDIKMLCVDYDDFVLSVIKKLYLEGQNRMKYNTAEEVFPYWETRLKKVIINLRKFQKKLKNS